jgi:hypothetical protein
VYVWRCRLCSSLCLCVDVSSLFSLLLTVHSLAFRGCVVSVHSLALSGGVVPVHSLALCGVLSLFTLWFSWVCLSTLLQCVGLSLFHSLALCGVLSPCTLWLCVGLSLFSLLLSVHSLAFRGCVVSVHSLAGCGVLSLFTLFFVWYVVSVLFLA